jgi:hypothetical protein
LFATNQHALLSIHPLPQELQADLKRAKEGKKGEDGKVLREDSVRSRLEKKKAQLQKAEIQAQVGGEGREDEEGRERGRKWLPRRFQRGCRDVIGGVFAIVPGLPYPPCTAGTYAQFALAAPAPPLWPGRCAQFILPTLQLILPTHLPPCRSRSRRT